MTTLINIYAGPGAGKSTLAAEVFMRLKKAGHSAELVTEYVKEWVYRAIPVGPFDDVVITANQLHRESVLYGKVDYIVTDSPIGLGAVFERIHNPDSRIMLDLCRNIRKRQDAAGVNVVNMLLKRQHAFVQEGRFHDEYQSHRADAECESLLRTGCNRPFYFVNNADDVLWAVGLGAAI